MERLVQIAHAAGSLMPWFGGSALWFGVTQWYLISGIFCVLALACLACQLFTLLALIVSTVRTVREMQRREEQNQTRY
jgi:membrane protein implicated in regulation of membrane protease activity